MFYQLLLLHRSSPKEAERKLEKTHNDPESLVATACKSLLNSLSGSVKEKRPLIATKQEKDENLGNQNGKYLNQKGSILLPQNKTILSLCAVTAFKWQMFRSSLSLYWNREISRKIQQSNNENAQLFSYIFTEDNNSKLAFYHLFLLRTSVLKLISFQLNNNFFCHVSRYNGPQVSCTCKRHKNCPYQGQYRLKVALVTVIGRKLGTLELGDHSQRKQMRTYTTDYTTYHG